MSATDAKRHRCVVVTGAGGLVGGACVTRFAASADRIIGIDNDMRGYFFGDAASTKHASDTLQESLPNYEHVQLDIRDRAGIDQLFAEHSSDIDVVIHTAAQPSHDWAAREPFTDFDINATGTLNLLEALRAHCPEAVFVFTSTNKVYGDAPNRLPLVERETRFELDPSHEWAEYGIPESMSLDECTHSLFGVSKVAADLLVQEYGRYFGLKTGVFRGGCLTGPGHQGAELHGFLAYLMKCTTVGTPYTVFGYEAKQVRDNLHVVDLADAFEHFVAAPRPAAVYNMGGGPVSNCSMLEAIELCGEVAGRELHWSLDPEPRIGDHIWYVSDLRRFMGDYPAWQVRHTTRDILEDIHAAGESRWAR